MGSVQKWRCWLQMRELASTIMRATKAELVRQMEVGCRSGGENKAVLQSHTSR